MSIFDVLFSYLVRGRMDLRVNRSTGRPRRYSRKNLRSMYPLKVAGSRSSTCVRSPALSSKSRTSFLSHTELYNLAVRFDLQEDFLQSRKARITWDIASAGVSGFWLVPSILRKIWQSRKRYLIFSASTKARAVLQTPPMPRKPVMVAHLSKLAKISSDSHCDLWSSRTVEELPRYGHGSRPSNRINADRALKNSRKHWSIYFSLDLRVVRDLFYSQIFRWS